MRLEALNCFKSCSTRQVVKGSAIALSIALVALGVIALIGTTYSSTPFAGVGQFLGRTGAFVSIGAGVTPLLVAALLNKMSPVRFGRGHYVSDSDFSDY